MKKYFAVLMVIASIMAVSCKKDDDKGGSIKKPGGDEDTELHASLQGSSYFPIILDSESADAIKNKITLNLAPNDQTNWLWIWEDTYAAGDGAGLNFYGNTTGYTDLVVKAGPGWSGAGFCVYTIYEDSKTGTSYTASPNPFDKIASTIGAHPEDYYFHLAYKGEASVAHIVGVDYAGKSYKFAIGEGSLADKGVTYNAITPKSGAFEAGEWNEYEIPVKNLGLDFTAAADNGTNIFWCLSGGVGGTEIKVDAVFFYKK